MKLAECWNIYYVFDGYSFVCPDRPIDFAQPVSFENADIGRCPTLVPDSTLEEDKEKNVTQALVLPEATTAPKVIPAILPSVPPTVSESHYYLLLYCTIKRC